MPQGEAFWNPYRMVPARENIVRERPGTDEKWTGLSGWVSCSIENLTFLFIGKNPPPNNQKSFLRDKQYAIPGSSLKGMLRSLAELAGGGCFATNDKGFGINYANLPPQSHRACSDHQRLCVTCRMFGMMGKGKNAKNHMGNIRIGEAVLVLVPAQAAELNAEIFMSGHGARHQPFYMNPVSEAFDGLCRKLYFHQPACRAAIPPVSYFIKKKYPHTVSTICALAPGHRFTFTVQFSCLTETELSLLLYVLALENPVSVEIPAGDDGTVLRLSGPMRHKIGYAKPLGLGTCSISIDEIGYMPDPCTRLATLADTEGVVLRDSALLAEIHARTAALRADTSPTMVDLRKMMIWDENDKRSFHYPSNDWFGANGNVCLKRI